jgi:hypothetical protein
MKRSVVPRLGSVVAIVLALAVAPAPCGGAGLPGLDTPPSAAGSGQGTVLERLTDVGSAIRLGFGVSPLHGPLAPAPAAIPGVQEGESGTVVSFDLNLKWPGAAKTGPIEPYVVLGPALFVVEPDDAGRLLGTRLDPTLQLGARAGAGLNWRLGKRATLFGGYEITTRAPGGLAPLGAGAPAERGISGHDFTYGLRFLY